MARASGLGWAVVVACRRSFGASASCDDGARLVGVRSMTTAAVEISHISCRYGDGPIVLDDVSLLIPNGQRVAIVGPNGAGKSTLLWHLNGLLPETPTESSRIKISG